VVVHGIHAILWALDKLVETSTITEQIVALKAQFNNFIPVGSKLDLKLLGRDRNSVQAELSVGNLRTATLIVTFGTRQGIKDIELPDNAREFAGASQPVNFSRLEDMANLCGSIDILEPLDKIQQHFPYASSAIGSSRVTAVARLSTLVGMICPGLHSLLGGFAIELGDNLRDQDRVGFQVSGTDDRFGMVQISICGAGIQGSVQSILRSPPISQASLDTIMDVVSPTEFAGSTTLIIGGSRGLGALTAKILAAGGGKVIVTYATGQEDAAALAAEIRNQIATDSCHILPYNTNQKAAAQLKRQLQTSVTHLYYFATGTIARQKSNLFEVSLFDEFVQMYVKGFYDICVYLSECGSRPIAAFYPSSVFVESRPSHIVEYSMAKMVGEMLCSDINRAWSRVHITVTRLPPLMTDQTATLLPRERGDPLNVMLPVIRDVQTARSAPRAGAP
jgi:NAD(P)-dependent dehydrogenase (short-subunit alcohol dehydrogenase family)